MGAPAGGKGETTVMEAGLGNQSKKRGLDAGGEGEEWMLVNEAMTDISGKDDINTLVNQEGVKIKANHEVDNFSYLGKTIIMLN